MLGKKFLRNVVYFLGKKFLRNVVYFREETLEELLSMLGK